MGERAHKLPKRDCRSGVGARGREQGRASLSPRRHVREAAAAGGCMGGLLRQARCRPSVRCPVALCVTAFAPSSPYGLRRASPEPRFLLACVALGFALSFTAPVQIAENAPGPPPLRARPSPHLGQGLAARVYYPRCNTWDPKSPGRPRHAATAASAAASLAFDAHSFTLSVSKHLISFGINLATCRQEIDALDAVT
jgi:hypothetical protein